MGKFLEGEKPKQAEFKTNPDYFSGNARADGFYKTKYRTFCLPREHAGENLLTEIRKPMMDYFAKNEIKWHDGQAGKPSNHMCDSQVCCANFLFPFYDKPVALAALLRPYFPYLKKMLPIEDEYYVACEWIGEQDYLGEKKPGNVKRTRGANYTSADAAVMFRRVDGKKQIVLIEWKYTESYYPTWLKIARSGTDRTVIYKKLYRKKDCPISKVLLHNFNYLFYEPFYQLMRQQFLANEMEKVNELGADIVSLLHISPAHNRDFLRVTSPELRRQGNSPIEVWQKLVIKPDRFTGVHTEELFGKFHIIDFPDLKGWWQYITTRYPWVLS